MFWGGEKRGGGRVPLVVIFREAKRQRGIHAKKFGTEGRLVIISAEHHPRVRTIYHTPAGGRGGAPPPPLTRHGARHKARQAMR